MKYSRIKFPEEIYGLSPGEVVMFDRRAGVGFGVCVFLGNDAAGKYKFAYFDSNQIEKFVVEKTDLNPGRHGTLNILERALVDFPDIEPSETTIAISSLKRKAA